MTKLIKSTTNFKLLNFKLLFTIALAVLVPIVLTLAGCKGGGGATKPTTKPVAKPKLQADMSNPQQMYCIRNNTKIRDFDKTYTDWTTDLKTERGFTNYAKIGKLSKYENVTVYEILGNWAYIKTIGDVKGWTPAKYLKKWDVSKFFKVKDNIFSVKSTKELYNDAVLGKVYAKINKGDTIRVLWGNGKRFFVVSKSGKSGWLSAESVDFSKLIVKNVDIESITRQELPVLRKYKNKSLDPCTPEYSIISFSETSFIGKDGLFDANISNKLLVAKQVLGSTQNTILIRDGETAILQEKIDGMYSDNYTSYLSLLGRKYFPVVEIDGNKYYQCRMGQINYLGMIGVFDIYKRKEFMDTEEMSFSGDYEVFLNYNYERYLKSLHNHAMEKGWKNKIKITFYTRDTKVQKISETWLEGYFGLERVVLRNKENFVEKDKSITKDNNGGLNIKISTYANLLSDYVNLKINSDSKPKIKTINIHITKNELDKVGWTDDDIIYEWDSYIQQQELLSTEFQFDKKYFYDKSIIVDGEKYYYKRSPQSTSEKYYFIIQDYKLVDMNENIFTCFYINKLSGKKGQIIYFINSKGEISLEFENDFAKHIVAFNNLGIIFWLGNGIEIFSGVSYEY